MPDELVLPRDRIEFFNLVRRMPVTEVVRLDNEEVEFVELPKEWVRILLHYAEQARPRGRQPRLSGRAKMREAMVLARMKARKAELIEGGMRPGRAEEQAAEEAATQLGLSRNLAASTLKRRMRKHPRR
jgi:hypothetical protein